MNRLMLKKLMIFSDGSSVLLYKNDNKLNGIVSNLNKDLKSFQVLTKQDSLNSSTNFYNTTLTNTFRKKLFK